MLISSAPPAHPCVASRLAVLPVTALALVLYLALSGAATASTISDLLIALESDGRTHIVQHTVASEGRTLTLTLPGSVIPQEVRFMGPDRVEQAQAHKANPGVVTLSSGSAFARYGHQYGAEVIQAGPAEFSLSTISRPENVQIDSGELGESSITWVFPGEFEVTSYTVTDRTTGTWVADNNTLTFHQLGPDPVALSIEYRYRKTSALASAAFCADGQADSDACSPDRDADGIPDYRDLCTNSPSSDVGILGCENNDSIILNDIAFASGHTYLDVKARKVLDRAAHAIQKHAELFFEIGAHTDNAGKAIKNKKLSQKRADAVRHYLMLRGVGPNAVRATGYGEKFPIRDNAQSQGQRANRRIELTIIR